MYIKYIAKNVTASITIFVDDTKVKNKIEKEEDVENLQMNLDLLYLWQEENKMLFNGTKFQLLRYGQNEDINNDTLYFTDNTENVPAATDQLTGRQSNSLLDPHNIVYKVGLGCLNRTPKAPINSVYNVMTVTSYESSKNIQ